MSRVSEFDLTASLVLYNHTVEDVRPVLNGLARLELTVHLAIIDNSSTRVFDHTQLSLYPFATSYRHLGENIGFGRAHNLAFSELSGRASYHCLLNPDVRDFESAVQKIVSFMKANDYVGIAVPRVYGFDGRLHESYRLLPDPLSLLLRRFLLPLDRKRDVPRRSLTARFAGRTMVSAPSLTGCFMIVRTSVAADVGLFDPRFFLYMEDVDLSRRFFTASGAVCLQTATIEHGRARQSYSSFPHVMRHIYSAVQYFNKWGWFADAGRRKINGTARNQ